MRRRRLTESSSQYSKCDDSSSANALNASKDIATAVQIIYENNNNDNRVTLRVPVGHNMIVSFSRNRFATFLNKGGRPVVDALAKELVNDILPGTKTLLATSS